uniref:RNA helicase n=1 Tax=Percolomonas cosmopolitus TaxID=63605 RepID=A0A7S1KNE6_9EUKA
MALMPHDLLDQCGGRDFVLINADAILQEHVLEKYVDMEEHGGQFLHFAFLIEKFVLEMQKRNVKYHVVFFESEKYGMIYSEWYKKVIKLPELDEITHQNKVMHEFELHSRWVPNTTTYQLMRLVLKWYLNHIGIETKSFQNWLDDPKWNEYLRDGRPSFIHGTDNTYLPMYYNFSKYDLKLTRDFAFEGNIINGFGSDVMDAKRIDRVVVSKIEGSIKKHLKKANVPLNPEKPTEAQLVAPHPDEKLVSSVQNLAQSDNNYASDENRPAFVLLALANLMQTFEEGSATFNNFSKALAFQLSQLLLTSSLLQITLPLNYRVQSLDEESEETATRITQFIHLVHSHMITLLENEIVPTPFLQDLIDGRLFHKLCMLYFEKGSFSEVQFTLPESIQGSYAAGVEILRKSAGSVQTTNVDKEWKNLVKLVDVKPKTTQRDTRLAPVSNPLIQEFVGEIQEEFESISSNQFRQMIGYDEEVSDLYDWKAARKLSDKNAANAVTSERKRKNREEAQLRLFKYSQALQNGRLLNQRVITVTEQDSKGKKAKKKQRMKTKTSVVIIQVKNRLGDIQKVQDEESSIPAHKALSTYREQLKQCYQMWRDVIDLPMDAAANDIIRILEQLWDFMKYFMQGILKQLVDDIKLIPAKSDYQKWSIFHQSSFANDLSIAFRDTGAQYDVDLKQKVAKKKIKGRAYRGSIVDDQFFNQFRKQIVLSLERAGFHRQAQLMQGVKPTKTNDISPWTLELMYHYADNSIATYVPPKKVELGENMLDLGFTPDPWQQTLIEHVESSHSVLVSAPTSSGKTFIAFYAIEKVLRESDEGVSVFVCPTKALVNQVYAEVLAKYTKTYVNENQHMVGVSTGDQKIHETTCQVLVTTPGSLEGLMMDPTKTEWKRRLRYVILDEIHTINEQGGEVWEHLLLMLNCPFLALSATLGDPQKFVNWLSHTSSKGAGGHGSVHLVEHKERPCPLEYSVYVPDFESKDSYVPSYAVETRRSGETDTSKMKDAAAYMGDGNIPVEAEESEEDEESGEDDENTNQPPTDDEDQNGQEERSTEARIPVSQEIVNAGAGDLYEIHPVAVLNEDRVIKEEIENMFLMSPKQCLRLYQAAEKYAEESGMGNLFSDLNPNSLEQVELVSSQTFIDYRVKMNKRLVDLSEKPEMHKDLLRLFAILREDVDKGFEEIYSHMDVTQYNSEDYLSDNIIGLVRRLKEEKRLPAIIFNLDHHFIDQMMELLSDYIQTNGYNLWDTEEDRRRDQTLIRSSCETLTGVDKKYLQALQNGIAVHYNSLSADYQMEAERLFRMRVVPIIIATGTLALGINMPCKSVVVAGKSVYLSTTLFNQMSGRAGRRGFDAKGSVILYGIPRASVNRFMTSPNPQILSSSSMAPSFILRLLQLYSEQTTDEHRKMIKEEILQIIDRPFFSQVTSVPVEQVKYQILFHLDFLARNGFIDENGDPRDFAGLVSRLSNHEPFNFLMARYIIQGLLHKQVEAERDIIAKKRQEQAEIMAEKKKEQIAERASLQRARKRTGGVVKKHEKEIRKMQARFEKEVRSVFSLKSQEQIVILLSYLFSRSNLYVGDMTNTQLYQNQKKFFNVQEASLPENYELQKKIAKSNSLPEMQQEFYEAAQKYYDSVMDTYTNFVVSYAKKHRSRLADNRLPISGYKAYDPVSEQLKAIHEEDQEAEAAAQEQVAAEEPSSKKETTKEDIKKDDDSEDMEWDDEESEDMQWDADASDEEEEAEETKESEQKEEEAKSTEQELSLEDRLDEPEVEGIEKTLANISPQSYSVSSFAALSGHGDDYDDVSKLLYLVKHTIPLDPNGVPARKILEYPLNSLLLDYFKHGSIERLQEQNLVTNVNAIRSEIQNSARDLRGTKYALKDIAKPGAHRDDTLLLLIDKVAEDLQTKISGQREKYRFKLKGVVVKATDEEKYGKKATRKDKSWGDKHAPDANVERVRKETGRDRGAKGEF